MQKPMIESMEAELIGLRAEFKRLEDIKTSVAKTISEAIQMASKEISCGKVNIIKQKIKVYSNRLTADLLPAHKQF